MRSIALVVCTAALFEALGASSGRAECLQDSRPVNLDGSNATCGDKPCTGVALRTYTCRTSDPNGPAVRVEFDRFSDGAASAIIARKASSKGLTDAIGSPLLIDNEVSKTYADLLKRFGAISQGDFQNDRWLKLEAPQQQTISATVSMQDIPTLISTPSSDGIYSLFYPAASEIATLRTRTIPAALNYFYTGDPGDKTYSIVFWRPMKSADVTQYGANVAAYNRLLRQAEGKNFSADEAQSPTVPGDLKLLDFLAGSSWPSDFVIISASANADVILKNFNGPDCGGSSISALSFNVLLPTVLLDAVTIENISSHPIKLDSLFGGRADTVSLRALGSHADAQIAAKFDVSQELAPGQKLLFPTRITLVPQCQEGQGCAGDAGDWSRMLKASADIQRHFKPNVFRNMTRTAVPLLKTYVYGPDVSIGGVVINGERIDFTQRSANFVDLVMSREGLSCPYLMSWDVQRGKWVVRRKILDKAPDKQREYTDVERFPGFQSRFRIEEREPEVAFLKAPALTVTLNSGEVLTLEPVKIERAEREGDYYTLYWGDAMDVEFRLPDGIAAQQVLETRFAVPGYYRRYPNLLAQGGQ